MTSTLCIPKTVYLSLSTLHYVTVPTNTVAHHLSLLIQESSGSHAVAGFSCFSPGIVHYSTTTASSAYSSMLSELSLCVDPSEALPTSFTEVLNLPPFRRSSTFFSSNLYPLKPIRVFFVYWH